MAPINIAIELPDFDPNTYNNALRGQHLIAMKELRQQFSIGEEYTHVYEGLPEKVIPEVCGELNAGWWCWVLSAEPVFLPRSSAIPQSMLSTI